MPVFTMHRLLQRQLKRHSIDPNALPQEWQNFLKAVDEAYYQFDDDRAMLERSLELSSEELLQANTQLQELLNVVAAQVEERTAELARTNAELKQTLADLQKAQLQLVQSEKMSALGNLVAGVAHEINNPVGFIAGNLKPAQDYVRDLLGLIDLYQEKIPNPDDEIADEIDAIDLEFIREDLPKLIGSMQEGTDRITHISTSLRTFSRADSDRPTLFNLHDGIDSTLLILKHRLKASDRRPEIDVITHYDDLPQINCFAGQLNQVFMNIIANAIDALDEGFETGNIDRPCIHIYTEARENFEIVRIKDNAMGMPEEVKTKIFDHLFTTKGVGKGTGLGLAIVRQIVEDKHCGAIEINSELGKGTEFVIYLPLNSECCLFPSSVKRLYSA